MLADPKHEAAAQAVARAILAADQDAYDAAIASPGCPMRDVRPNVADLETFQRRVREIVQGA